MDVEDVVEVELRPLLDGMLHLLLNLVRQVETIRRRDEFGRDVIVFCLQL